MAEGLYFEDPLFRALHSAGMLDGIDYLGVGVQLVARSTPEDQPPQVLAGLLRLKPLIDGGWLTTEQVLESMEWACRISLMTEEELRAEGEKLRDETNQGD